MIEAFITYLSHEDYLVSSISRDYYKLANDLKKVGLFMRMLFLFLFFIGLYMTLTLIVSQVWSFFKGFGLVLNVGFRWEWYGLKLDGLGTIQATVGLWSIRKIIILFSYQLGIACLGLLLDYGNNLIVPMISPTTVLDLILTFSICPCLQVLLCFLVRNIIFWRGK